MREKKIIKFLVESKADVNQASNGLTPMPIILKKTHDGFAIYLRDVD